MSDTEMATSKKKKKSVKTEEVPMETEAAAAAAAGGEDAAPEVEPHVSPIANPLANKKLAKKCLKLVKKAATIKSVRRGVKEVVKAVRKGEKGVMFIAANITPIDVVSHLPVLCEEQKIPYVYVPSKEELGVAGATKRPTSVILVQLKDKTAEHKEAFDEVVADIKKVTPAVTD